jgi:uncharacterized protein
MTIGVSHVLGDEVLELLPEKSIFWSRRKTLIATDTHFGKDATFRALGIPIPSGSDASTLAALTSALEKTSAERLVVLGDFFHDRRGMVSDTLDALREWRRSFAALSIAVVEGNHDRHSDPAPEDLRIERVDEGLADGPFVFAHMPADSERGYILAGHVHPAITLAGGGDRLRLPCFLFRPSHAILPAIGAFTGLHSMVPGRGDKVYAVAGSAVVEVV